MRDLVYDIMNDKQRKEYEEFLETEISIISTGPERSQTIDKKKYLDSI